MLPKVVGVRGKARHGKDTAANYLIEKFGFERPPSFSQALKEMALRALLTCPPMGYIASLSRDEYEQWAANPEKFWRKKLWDERDDFSRWILQFLGTDIFRNQVDIDYWVDRWYTEAFRMVQQGKKIVVPDVRFKNEAKAIRELGGEIWHVIRTDAKDLIEGGEYAAAHPSETEALQITPDRTIAVPTGIENIHRVIDSFAH